MNAWIKISRPIRIKMTPPTTEARLDNLVPAFLPSNTPVKQMMKVVIATMVALSKATEKS